jgi:periplasmic protein TonB
VSALAPTAANALQGHDRLGVAVGVSLAAHLVLLLGLGFMLPHSLPRMTDLSTLEIVLVSTRSDTEPEDARILAQASQDGGGDSSDAVAARSPLPPMLPDTTVQPPAMDMPVPAAEPETQTRADVLVADTDAPALAAPDPVAERPEPNPVDPAPGLPANDAFRVERSLLSAEISRAWETYQERPRRRFISASTREHRFAAYMDAWRARVEQIGNLNYPEEARRRGLSGDLVLDVAVRPDGSVQDIALVRSSGHSVLDDAAMRIVRLSAPYEEFPDAIREDTDLLHIVRTWEFSRGNRITTR